MTQLVDAVVIGSGFGGFTFSFLAFPEESYTTTLRDHFEFCHGYGQQHGDRPNMLSVGYSVGKDQNSLLSYAYDGPSITIDAVSTGGAAWTRFLDAYTEFCIGRDGKLLNQTPQLTREQLRRAYGDRLAAFAQVRRAHDPDGRLLNPYFTSLLGADHGSTARPRPAGQGAIR
jgi:hypothetical protein